MSKSINLLILVSCILVQSCTYATDYNLNIDDSLELELEKEIEQALYQISKDFDLITIQDENILSISFFNTLSTEDKSLINQMLKNALTGDKPNYPIKLSILIPGHNKQIPFSIGSTYSTSYSSMLKDGKFNHFCGIGYSVTGKIPTIETNSSRNYEVYVNSKNKINNVDFIQEDSWASSTTFKPKLTNSINLKFDVTEQELANNLFPEKNAGVFKDMIKYNCSRLVISKLDAMNQNIFITPKLSQALISFTSVDLKLKPTDLIELYTEVYKEFF